MDAGLVLVLLVGTWYTLGAIAFAVEWYFRLRHTPTITGMRIALIMFAAVYITVWPLSVDWKAVKSLFWGKMPGGD